jgi:hypothetical protein
VPRADLSRARVEGLNLKTYLIFDLAMRFRAGCRESMGFLAQ